MPTRFIVLWLAAKVGIILLHEFQFFFSRHRRAVTCFYGDAQPDLVAD
jgi:hypothetical protein